MERDGKRQGKSADITYRLANFKSRQPPKGGQYANQGDKKQTAACRCHKICPQGFPDGLQIHVRQTDQRQQGKRQKLPTQGARADVYDRGIVAKFTNYFRGKGKTHRCNNGEENRAIFHAEEKALTHTAIKSCTVAKATQRLKSLSKSDNSSEDEEAKAPHN